MMGISNCTVYNYFIENPQADDWRWRFFFSFIGAPSEEIAKKMIEAFGGTYEKPSIITMQTPCYLFNLDMGHYLDGIQLETTDLDMFNSFLQLKAGDISQFNGKQFGTRTVDVSSYLIARLITENRLEDMWRVIKSQLPPDAIHAVGGKNHLMQNLKNGVYTQELRIFFVSTEWIDEDGGPILSVDVDFESLNNGKS